MPTYFGNIYGCVTKQQHQEMKLYVWQTIFRNWPSPLFSWAFGRNMNTWNEFHDIQRNVFFSLSLSVRVCVVVINNKYEEIWSHNLGETSKSYYQREFLNTITNSLNMYNTSGFNLKIHNLWRKNWQRLFIILFTSNKSLWSFCNNAINLSDSWGNLWKYLKLGNNIFQATFF